MWEANLPKAENKCLLLDSESRRFLWFRKKGWQVNKGPRDITLFTVAPTNRLFICWGFSLPFSESFFSCSDRASTLFPQKNWMHLSRRIEALLIGVLYQTVSINFHKKHSFLVYTFRQSAFSLGWWKGKGETKVKNTSKDFLPEAVCKRGVWDWGWKLL